MADLLYIKLVMDLNIMKTGVNNYGETNNQHQNHNHKNLPQATGGTGHKDMPTMRVQNEMTHIETRRELKKISLVADFNDILDRCMLSDEDKGILRMFYIQKKDFRYIGDMLGYSERTIKSRHKKALQKISHAL